MELRVRLLFCKAASKKKNLFYVIDNFMIM